MPSHRIHTDEDVTSFIAAQAPMVAILRLVERLGLPDCWVGAGFVRNVVWDALHGRAWSPSYEDVDVIYFDADASDRDHDIRIENTLRRSMRDVPWSVKNQARMNSANGDQPYLDAEDALRHWPEICTAVAVRAAGPRLELLAPFGTTDLVALIVNPTPAFAHKIDIYRARVTQKRWQERWPRLRITGLSD